MPTPSSFSSYSFSLVRSHFLRQIFFLSGPDPATRDSFTLGPVDFIGRIEDIDTDWEHIWRRLKAHNAAQEANTDGDSNRQMSDDENTGVDGEVEKKNSLKKLNTKRVSIMYGHWFFRQRRSKVAGETLCQFLMPDFECFEYEPPDFCSPGFVHLIEMSFVQLFSASL